jgi:EmrB/QacA subfamily drug resistance transporter
MWTSSTLYPTAREDIAVVSPNDSRLPSPGLRITASQGRWVLIATILGSSIAGVDSSVVNVTLPAIGRGLGASFAALQWTVTGYTLSVASLILLAGGLGDRFGRRRMFLIGIAAFTAASVLCAIVSSIQMLVCARVIQGIGGALMTPASLAILQSTITVDERPRAIGIWSGFGGVSTVIAPFIGGWLLDLGTWRWIFLINVPIAALVLVVTVRHVPETRDDSATRMDWSGSLLAVVTLASATWALTSLPTHVAAFNWSYVAAFVAIAAAVAFVWCEKHSASAILPGCLMRSRAFITINVITFLVYGAFGVFSLVFTIALETVSGYSPAEAGSTLLPVTAITLALSGSSGKLATRIGPGAQLALGPALCAFAALLALQISPATNYWTVVLPLECVFGLGIAVMAPPLTSVALSSVPGEHAGVASAVNNVVSRSAALLWIAALPPIVGLTGASYTSAALFLPGYREACVICAVALIAAGAMAGAVFRSHVVTHRHLHLHAHVAPTLPQPLCR